jgi:hypothetical protein
MLLHRNEQKKFHFNFSVLHRDLRKLLQPQLRRHRDLVRLPAHPARLRVPDQACHRQEMQISSSDPVHSGCRRNRGRMVFGAQRKTRTQSSWACADWVKNIVILMPNQRSQK